MTDWIRLRDLVFKGRHGVLPEERERSQRFEVDLELGLDLEPAVRTDDLSLSVDVRALPRLVRELVEGPPVDLVETLAGRIAEQLLQLGPVSEVVVRMRKPEAPLPDGAEPGYEVEIRRRRYPEPPTPGRRRGKR